MEQALEIRKARISVRGIVQGVGFRPFVYQLATQHGLKGWVCNTSGDVKIEVEGTNESIENFCQQLNAEPPPLAQIEQFSYQYFPPEGYQLFEIKESRAESGKYQRISPDIPTCSLCLKELLDPHDRRYRYAFINCTNCGPRFTIIQDIPYDRPKTTMQQFKMCPACAREYYDPFNRRFHAQPNCCSQCGPQLDLVDHRGNLTSTKDPVAAAGSLLKEGKIIAVKGLGGFLLACDATNEASVQLLRQRKKRPFKPFAVMTTTVAEVRMHCFVSSEEEKLLTSPQSPIVLLRLKDRRFIAPGVAPHLHYLGVMLPYTPLHHLLVREVPFPLVMTSGNFSEEPIVKDNDEALKELSKMVDYFLLHNRDIHIRCDDSVSVVNGKEPQVVRRARSYAPDPILLPFRVKEVLACGAELKNTFCITKDEYAFLSQHIGDLDNLETLNHYEHVLDHYQEFFRLHPQIVAHDKHPDYLSTTFAKNLKGNDDRVTLIPVQHHHAHIVSCMMDNNVNPPVIGVAFDGTGYGDDGHIWGGEFLLVDYARCTRLGHIEYVPLPGGDAAIKRPYRMAISYLLTLLGKEVLLNDLAFLGSISPVEIELITKQVERRLNTPLVSSAGRLFDAVSALLEIRGVVDYEGQAAIELEMMGRYKEGRKRTYPFVIADQDGLRVIRLRELFSAILEDLAHDRARGEVAVTFHRTISEIITQMCQEIARDTGIGVVALSGGVFQNRTLLQFSRQRLQEAGMTVVTHKGVPCNDGGISLGQAIIANFVMNQH